ncbi:MAG: hypothetical protein IAE97_13155 [Chthoniobacterales bacterium]|nr:hypothetical protein [Chthoniobacterales bacterium]
MSNKTIIDLIRQLSDAVTNDHQDRIESQIADSLPSADNKTLAYLLRHRRVSTRSLYDGALREAVARLLCHAIPDDVC